VKIDKRQQKIKIVHTNRQSNLGLPANQFSLSDSTTLVNTLLGFFEVHLAQTDLFFLSERPELAGCNPAKQERGQSSSEAIHCDSWCFLWYGRGSLQGKQVKLKNFHMVKTASLF